MSGETKNPLFGQPFAEAEIDVYGGISVAAALLDSIMDILTVTQTEFVPCGSTRYAREKKRLAWYELQSDGRVRIPTGCVPRVCDALTSTGVSVVVRDHRHFDGERYQSDPEKLNELPAGDATVINAIANNPIGQIEVRNLSDMVHDIACIASAYPRARIVIATGRHRDAYGLAQRLRSSVPEYVGVATTKHPMGDARIYVSTYWHTVGASPWDLEFLLLTNPAELGGLKAIEGVARLATVPRHIYAFVRRKQPLGRAAALATEAFAGQVIHRAGPEPVDVRVMLCSAASYPSRLPESGLQRKRAIWQHAARNTLIASIAQAAAMRDRRALWEYGLFLDLNESEWFEACGDSPVTVLVETTEHARNLQADLPGWRVRSLGTPEDPACLGRDSIMTWNSMARYGIESSIVVRADGGSSLPVMKFTPGADQIVLIDVDDELDGMGRQDVRRRLSDYRRRRWQIDGRSAAAKASDADVLRRQHGETNSPISGEMVNMMEAYYASAQKYALGMLREDSRCQPPEIRIYPSRLVKAGEVRRDVKPAY
jgi:hypothetical protein